MTDKLFIENLLSRKVIKINHINTKKLIEDKVVFITGAGGSIGSELSRQIIHYKPKKIVNIDVNENSLYFLELELKDKNLNTRLVTEVCYIKDQKKLDYLFKKYLPDILFHAAAHKHVPLMEHNPEEAIKNNIFGTKNLVNLSTRYNLEKFILISTDKAVNPTSVMGATKRACELIIEKESFKSKTKFIAVRFGNVLGSNGSVIPIFKRLLSEERDLKVTHPDITRYFMTIAEAVELVLEAGGMGNGGEIFILDMGKPIKILDLANKMIDLYKSKSKIEFIGLRPGEKLYEELLYDVKSSQNTESNKIFISKNETLKDEIKDLSQKLKVLESLLENPVKEELKKELKKIVKTYVEVDYKKNN